MVSKIFIAFIGIVLLLGCAQPAQTTNDSNNSDSNSSGLEGGVVMATVEKVSNGDMVKVDYTGKLTDGSVFDSSIGREPLEFEVGAGQMIKGFDEGVVGMALGETKTITLAPEDAYGPVREEAMQWVEKSQLPSDLNIVVGTKLMTSSGMQVTVVDINATAVKVDFNHPLAGKTLIFEVKVVGLQKGAK